MGNIRDETAVWMSCQLFKKKQIKTTQKTLCDGATYLLRHKIPISEKKKHFYCLILFNNP